MIIVLFPWTSATRRIHSLSGRILNITTDGKRPYVKAKVNGYGRKFLICLSVNLLLLEFLKQHFFGLYYPESKKKGID